MIKHSIGSLASKYKAKQKQAKKIDAVVKAIALAADRDIVRRAGRGVDIHGSGFTRYSRAYAAKKSAITGSSKVDLRLTGDMFGSMGVSRIAKAKYKLHFRGASANTKATTHNRGLGNMPRREFFGISRKIRKLIKAKSDAKARVIVK